ncbi:hypothetical protein, partial [Fusobacterium mortiferum]|uniref:hypothetical protein n=1 Tax=Fusobacterium mortiferum TaxID=850 RepID=UPI003A4D83AD
MAQYKETVNTEKALNLIAKMLAGKIEQIDFTKIKVSDKDYSLLSIEELQKLEELEEIRQETLVSEKVLLDDNTINVHGIIYNTDLENSYYLRTIGLYANDPDEGEILYSITPASHADYVSTPNGNNITTIILDLKTVISGATVNLQGNPSALVDVSMLNKKLDRGEGLEEEFDTGVKIVNELKKKQNKEDSTLKTVVKTIVGAINELYNELVKKATKTQLGRIKVGNNLTVDEDGTLHGTPEYTHPTGNGNNHIPANGVSGNFLKWLSSGAAQWTNITWSDITGKPNSFTPSSHNHTKANITDFPTSMKNPYALTISLNGTSQGAYDGAAAKSINITPASIGAAASSHTHTKANITDFPASMKNPYALSIQLNSGTAYTYDGAATKNINITPASIGAADSSHTHTKANITDFPTSMKNPNALEIKMNGQNPVSYDGAAAKSINITASGIGAEPAFKKNGAFNKNFGTTSNTVLEGAKLAEILGLTYGGSLNTSSAKTVNYAYYDSTTKKVYKCIKATSINYADANYFEAISNNDLLGKLQN